MRRALALASTAAVAAALLAQAPSAPASADPDGAEAVLLADADGPLRIRREGGVATFVGTPAGTEVDNPAVGRGTTVSAAARAHLRRYGAAVGADRPSTSLTESSRSVGVSGRAVVRFQQEVGDLPVIGGDVVVTLGDDRDLTSLSAHLADIDTVAAATVTEDEARAAALGRVGRGQRGAVVAADQGRWVLDPATVALALPGGARGVWRFEVRVGADVRRLVLIDDRTGAVLLDQDLLQHADRVVCDQVNVALPDPPPCTSGFARTETSAPASGDVEKAFVHLGAASDFYEQVGGRDLTEELGVDTASGKKLAATVRVCVTGQGCPYGNAYWDGRAVFLGQGYAGADDVVAHELTHGVIERTSGLLYWDQSGAINESLADIVGEIVDHRFATAGDSPTDWRLGEDLPGGSLRNLADPPSRGHPDRMTSALWSVDAGYTDQGGVHRNSGVGNKAFHLISQGGTFNGQTVVGIDGTDPTLTRSAALWLEVLPALNAFSDYRRLAAVLTQSCAALADAGTLSVADCQSVQRAVAATEMTADPVSDPTVDPARSCPVGRVKRVLLDSEAVSEAGPTFTAGTGWGRTPGTSVNAEYGVHAFSGDTAWVAEDPTGVAVADSRVLATHAAIDVPAGQSTYLAFRHWYLLDFDLADTTPRFWDGGTVEIQQESEPGAVNAAGLPWQNGPTRLLQAPNAGVPAFSGSSRGWTGSQVDLSSYAGEAIRPRFTMRSDDTVAFVGWYLDDIEVYTCDPPLLSTADPVVTGTRRVGGKVSVTSAWNQPDTVVTQQWLRDGAPISGATAASYVPAAADVGRVLSVRVTGQFRGQSAGPLTVTSGTVARGVLAAPRTVSITGTPYVGRRLAAVRGTWAPAGVTFGYRWYRGTKAITGATGSTYVLRKGDKGFRVTVRITGSKAGYTSVHRTAGGVPVRR